MAQTEEATSPRGPFEMVLNRGICTLFGVFIVLAGDYFYFRHTVILIGFIFSSGDSL